MAETSKASSAHLRPVLFFLFAISGFSGLIYESIWSHYLKLILGHAAYAQTLVLAIFMGGMTLGAYAASRKSATWRFPLLVYAIIEGIVGITALLFHSVFIVVIDLLHNTLLPTLSYSFLIALCKWGIATLLILPQSILLGATFPAMSAGIIRRYPNTTGATLGMLYFTNSIGAAIGVLMSGFVFIPQMGLPGTIQLAGYLNLFLAVAVWALVKAQIKTSASPIAPTNDSDTTGAYVRLLVLAALLTGAASFLYEIAWIRMLSLVLSSTIQAFELMLSAFITGLAFGGLWIRRRIDKLDSPLRYAGHVQILMGIFALFTLPLYNVTFDAMAWLLSSLGKTDTGYTLFNLGSHSIALAIMLPATFMAGMTLPLFTYALIKRGHGEASIGHIYAANTIGAIIGVIAATHIIMPIAGSKGLIVLGAAIDITLGVVLLKRALPNISWQFSVSASVGVIILVFSIFGVHLNPLKMASGVYRYGQSSLPADTEVLYYKHGKTATVDLMRDRFGGISIGTNGKPEASIFPPNAPIQSSDDITMVMAAALPLALHKEAKTVANIGMGSGITAHALLGTQTLKRVDTIEIEAAVVEAAQGFGPYVARAYSDPRSHIHIDDAKTFFSSRQTQYDIIISEPSDPWVSGVAGLFSIEFYEHVNRYLKPDGLFVQWLELYESNIALISSVFKALSPHFSNYVVFNTNDTNILIIATNNRTLGQPDPWIFEQTDLLKDMQRANLNHIDDFNSRKLGNKALLQPFFESYGSPPNSDYFPFLGYEAPRSRFLGENAGDISWIHIAPIPVLEMIERRSINEPPTPDPNFSLGQANRVAQQITDIILSPNDANISGLPEPIRHATYLLVRELASQNANDINVREATYLLAKHTNTFLNTQTRDQLWTHLKKQPAYETLTSKTKNWLTLHEAIARRDHRTMMSSAGRIIETTPESQFSHEQLEYVLSAGLLGALSTGNTNQAIQFWSKYGGLGAYFKTEPALYLQVLLTQFQSI